MMNELQIYLAGGMKSNWQNIVINSLSDQNVTFYNPDTTISDPKIYVPNDIKAIDNSNIIFAYYELYLIQQVLQCVQRLDMHMLKIRRLF